MGLGALVERVLTRNVKYDVTNTLTGEQASFTVVTDGGPGMYPGWGYGAYRGLLGIPAADRAMSLIAGLGSQVHWQGFRRVAGRRPVALDPNPVVLDQPAGTFEIPMRTYYGWIMDRMAHGNGIGLVAARGLDGWPTSYLPVSAEFVQVKRVAENDPAPGFRVGEVAYLVNGRWYHDYEVIHFKGPAAPGGLRGMGVLENHFATLDRSRKLDQQAGAVDSSGVPTGLLKSLNPDLTKTEAQELKDAWRNAQVTRTVAVLNPSTEFEPIAWNPTELQLLEARKYTLTEWSNIFGIDLEFLGGENSSKAYSNIEQKGADLLRFGRPGEIIAEFAQTLTMALPRGQFVKPDLEFLLRSDKKTRWEIYAGAITAGWLSPSEARAAEDMEPLTAAQQDEIDRARGNAQQQLATGTGTPGEVAPASPALAMAATRAQLDLLVALLERGRHSYDPNQPRDPDGKWGSGGALAALAPAGGPRPSGRRAARQFTNDEMAVDYTEVRESATEEQFDALNMYAGDDYDSINAYLRTGRATPSAVTGNDPVAQTAAINELMGQYRTPGTVVGVRAVGRSLKVPPHGEALGKVITGEGFQSVTMTSTDKDVTEVGSSDVPRNYRSKPIRLRMIIPKGMPAAVVQGMPHAIASEREILLPHNTRYVVSDDQMERDKRWLTVTALPPE